MKRWLFLGLALPATLLAFAACGGGGEEGPSEDGHEAGALHVALDEWSITDGKTGATALAGHAGEVVLEVHNEGVAPHALSLIRTDLDSANLPLAASKVDEETAGQLVGKIEEFPGGQIRVASFTLAPGKYALVCNIPGHYQQGMHTQITIEE